MKGLSSKEMEIVSDLEFNDRYYFTREDIQDKFLNHKQMINTIYRLKKKERIIPLSKNKYFLVPVKAPESKWTDHPFIIIDEIMNGEDYFIGGWSAANYWGHTEQVPMQKDVWTTKRQGKTYLLNTRIMFHRTTKAKIKKVTIEQKTKTHSFKIMNSEFAKKWIKGRD